MSSDAKGAEPSLEEIVASIRRLVHADTTPSPAEPRADQDGDFDLPALFRSSQSSLADQLPPQIGAAAFGGTRKDWRAHRDNRGFDAKEDASQEPRMSLEQSNRQAPDVAAALSSLAQSLATVADPSLAEQQRDAPPLPAGVQTPETVAGEEIKPEEPALASDEFWSEPSPSPSPLPRPEPYAASDVPRQMVSCKDTLLIGRMGLIGRTGLIGRMGQRPSDSEAGAARGSAPLQKMPTDTFGYGPVIPAEFRIPDRQPSAAAAPGLEGGKSEPSKEPNGDAPHVGVVAEGFVDQAAVALLRPLLQQWLDSNMRSVLEKALHVEAESTKNREP